MKKTIALILIAAVILSLGMTSALAAAETTPAPHGAQFVDVNKDGTCDVCGSADTNGDGVCDGCPFGGVRPQDGTGRRMGRGRGNRGSAFVDSNGDGVCDNAGTCPRNGDGRRGGRTN